MYNSIIQTNMAFEKEHIMSVAETIQEQLFGLTPITVLMSWGISRLTATVIDDMSALSLHVNARIHKGEVIIALNEGVDYYEIYLRDGSAKRDTRKIARDVDFTQLSEIIDEAVESGTDKEEYYKFCDRVRRSLIQRGIL